MKKYVIEYYGIKSNEYTEDISDDYISYVKFYNGQEKRKLVFMFALTLNDVKEILLKHLKGIK